MAFTRDDKSQLTTIDKNGNETTRCFDTDGTEIKITTRIITPDNDDGIKFKIAAATGDTLTIFSNLLTTNVDNEPQHLIIDQSNNSFTHYFDRNGLEIKIKPALTAEISLSASTIVHKIPATYSITLPDLVYYSGSLDQIETHIRKDPKLLLATFEKNGMRGTLLQLTIIGLDYTIKNSKGLKTNEGMVERILTLHKELFPSSYPKALEQARFATLTEDENAKKARETANFAALNQAFDAIKQNENDAKKNTAIENFINFVKNAKPDVITDNRYHINLVHLLYGAITVFKKKSDQLPRIDNEEHGGGYGKLADLYITRVIGGIQAELPKRTQQILLSKLYHVFHSGSKATRILDIDGSLFLRAFFPHRQLGITLLYDQFGSTYDGGMLHHLGNEPFKVYYDQLYQQKKLLPSFYCSSQSLIKHSIDHIAEVSHNHLAYMNAYEAQIKYNIHEIKHQQSAVKNCITFFKAVAGDEKVDIDLRMAAKCATEEDETRLKELQKWQKYASAPTTPSSCCCNIL